MIPFGLTIAQALFQAINDTLRPCLNKYACAYLDNIVVYPRMVNEHISQVQKILEHLQTCGLFVQRKKCKFYRESIKFLDFPIGRGFIQMDPKKVESVASWPIPTRLKHLQAFLGFANFYRQFIKDYSQQALGMTKFLKKNKVFNGTTRPEHPLRRSRGPSPTEISSNIIDKALGKF